MRYSIFIIALLFLVSSCQDVERMEKPEDLIPEDKMVDVITEISLLQAARNYNKGMLEEKGLDPENYLWEKFDVDSLQFARSSNYYAENYDKYEAIYSRVKARLEGYRDVYDSLREAEERVQDSLMELEGDRAPIKRDFETAPGTQESSVDREIKEVFRDSIEENNQDIEESTEDTID